MNIQLLLTEISGISRKYDLINQKTGNYFNIFDIAGIGSDEVIMCRVIYELLNPKGSHCQGNLYLKLFVQHVIKMDFSESDYKTVKVYREYVITDDRRIDLVIETQDKFIPIEVKIYAEDQPKQCFDYQSKAKKSNMIYLTLYGNAPTPVSAKGLLPIYGHSNRIIGYRGITQISFSDEILNWLNYCLEQQETIRIAPIREIILQLISVIRCLTNQMEEGKEMEISETLLSSAGNLKSAIELEKALPIVKTKIMMDLYVELVLLFKNKGKEVIDFDNESINDFYKPNVRTYPAIRIKIKELRPDLIAALCIEISDNLYYYYAFMEFERGDQLYKNREVSDVKDKYKSEYELFTKAVENSMTSQGKKTKYTFFWEYIFNNDGEKYNFKQFTDACITLSQDTKNTAANIFKLLNQYVDSVAAKL